MTSSPSVSVQLLDRVAIRSSWTSRSTDPATSARRHRCTVGDSQLSREITALGISGGDAPEAALELQQREPLGGGARLDRVVDDDGVHGG
jgi:hypothetical protein